MKNSWSVTISLEVLFDWHEIREERGRDGSGKVLCWAEKITLSKPETQYTP